ncbi:MAG TPA: hypothetical protein VJ836_06735 [Candidatus Saccharimonadales bacterium]|nr:hypothetical protein [Candidatus Saccharimonadales bacterium]
MDRPHEREIEITSGMIQGSIRQGVADGQIVPREGISEYEWQDYVDAAQAELNTTESHNLLSLEVAEAQLAVAGLIQQAGHAYTPTDGTKPNTH